MKKEFLAWIESLEKEKDLSDGTVVNIIERAFETAAKKMDYAPPNVQAIVDMDAGDIKIFSDVFIVPDDEEIDEIVDDNEVEKDNFINKWHISKAKKYVPDAEIGKNIRINLSIDDFSRIAVQTARQIIMQRLKEAEREKVLNEYTNRIGDLVNGIISRYDHGNLIVDIDKTEAILPRSEQSPIERYKIKDRIRAVVIDVSDTEESKIPQVILSRATTGLVRRLFEIEVPEIYDGIVEIKNISREAGYRTKISVISHDPKIDSVGACVGIRGSRVKNIVQELNGERIDIVRWSDSIEEYVANALSPVKLVNIFADPDNEQILVVVPDDQISLAIGKSGQNIRLTSKLLNWKVDVVKESEAKRVAEEHGVDISNEGEVDTVFEEKKKSTNKNMSNIFMTEDEEKENKK